MRTQVGPTVRWTATLLLLAVACGRPAERSESLSEASTASFDPATPDDHRAWLELYDEAGFPDVSALRRVEFEAGRSWSGPDDELTIHLERAWVLSTSPLVLLQDSLWTHAPERAVEVPKYMQAPPTEAQAEPPREPISYREVDFAEELRAELDAAEALTEDDNAHHLGMNGRHGPRATYWLVRARWAQMRGLPELTRRALTQVERWATVDCGEEVCTPQDAIRSGFQLKLLWQATDGIGDFMPRPQARELVARARAVAPSGDYSALATELLDRLDRTIATDANGPPWPDGGEPARVQRLIHLLREQNGHQSGQPGACNPFAVDGPIRSPADELAALGREAIPALIEHIDDDTLTRSVGFHRDFHFSHHILSVGDVAVAIIERIAGRSFDVEHWTYSHMNEQEQAKAMQELVREWWAGASELSQREQLLRELDDADESQRNRIASVLLEKYGLAVWPQLIRTFDETKDEEARRNLLWAMHQWWSGPLGDEPAADREASERFLVGALDDRSATVRLAAAQTLGIRGRRDGTATCIRDLDRSWLQPVNYERYFEILVADGSAAAVDAIDRAIQRGGHDAVAALSSSTCRWWSEPCDPKLDGAAKARLLDTLTGYFDDCHDPGGSWGSGPARTRDLAAAAYAILTGRDVAALASKPTSIERDWMILDMLDAHRAEQQLPPVSWPHVAPPQGQPGRDHVQRVHLVCAAAHEDAAREWLSGFADRDLNPEQISTALVHLAERHPDVPFMLRIHRFPDDAGVILTLDVGPRAPSQSPGSIESDVACRGADCGRGFSSGSVSSTDSTSAPEVFADFLHDALDVAWNRKPTQIEEYTFQVKVSPEESSALTVLGCACTSSEDSNWGWLLLLAGLLPTCARSRRRRPAS